MNVPAEVHSSPSAKHEADRIAVRPILASIAGVFALIALACVVCALALRYFAVGRALRDVLTSPVPGRVDQWVNQSADLARHRADAASRLHSYEWLDRANGRARIPIDRAMELIAAPTTRPAEVRR